MTSRCDIIIITSEVLALQAGYFAS